MVGACKAAVTALQLAGLAVKPVRLPELDLLRAAHSCTITTEMRNNMTCECGGHQLRHSWQWGCWHVWPTLCRVVHRLWV